MPIVVVLDTSLSMLRRPFPDANFTYFSVAQGLIESLVTYVRRHHFMELMALVTASSRPQVRATFSRRNGYATLLDEVMSVGVEDKADYGRAITVAHNAALAAFGSAGTPVDIVFFTDDGAILHGVPEVPDQPDTAGGGGVVEGLPFRFPGNLYFLSAQGTAKAVARRHTPFERLIALNAGRGEVVRHPCAPTLADCIDAGLWPRLLPPHYGELRCGWLRADVQAHPPIRSPALPAASAAAPLFLVRVAGFVTPDDVSSAAVTSRHLLLPVIPKAAAVNGTGGGEEKENAGEAPELWYPCGTTEDDWKAPQFTALLHGSLASRHSIAVAELLPLPASPTARTGAAQAADPPSAADPGRQFALLHSELSSPTAAKRSNLTASVLTPGVDAVPWMGQLSFLASVADFERPPSGSVFPVKTLEPRSYAIGSGHVCWLWGNMALDVSKVMKHARRLAGAADTSAANSAGRVNAFYTDVNRVRSAALAFGASSLLSALKAMLERETSGLQDAASRRHVRHVVEQLMLPFDRLKRIEPPGGGE